MNNLKLRSIAKLPVYGLAAPQLSDDQLDRLARNAFGMESYSAERESDRLYLSTGSKRFEFNPKTGAMWMADQTQLWRPELKPRLPKAEEAEALAQKYLKKHGLLPKSEGGMEVKVGRVSTGGTHVATYDRSSKRRQNRQLDVHVSFGATVIVPSPERESKIRVPVIGETGKIGLTLGNKGEVISQNGAWRNADGIEKYARVIPQEESAAQFQELTSGLKLQSFDSSLAYQTVTLDGEHSYLCPVWVYRATAWIGDRIIPLRNIILPATEFGPEFTKPTRQLQRTKRAKPAPWAKGVPANYAKRSFSLLSTNPFEAGTSWIGLSGGLAGSKKNAQGFMDGLAADGWQQNFNWGDANAWESDWRRNDDDWVDAADFVFYTGHADGNGWVLSNPDDNSLNFNEVGASPQAPGDLYGQQDLEWIIVAACGPLEDDVIAPGGGNVFNRWDGAFDGLHLLMGYGAVTFDNEEEGKRVVQYARQGNTLIDAWFRAAREIQPSTNGYAAPLGPTVWVGVMYATRSGSASPVDDHLWGHGSVAPDPTAPNGFVAMWTVC